jgi:hypothetical protein
MTDKLAVLLERSAQRDRLQALDVITAQMRDALTTAADTFQAYAALHAAKGTPEGTAKAEANAAMAARMQAAMTGRPAAVAPTPQINGSSGDAVEAALQCGQDALRAIKARMGGDDNNGWDAPEEVWGIASAALDQIATLTSPRKESRRTAWPGPVSSFAEATHVR